jgi:hypothetical protein
LNKFALLAASAVIALGGMAVETYDATPSHADGCAGGGGFGGGGGYCDNAWWPDGSYQHCVTVYVLGFGGTSCGRVCPPPPGSAIPAPYPGPGPGGRCW